MAKAQFDRSKVLDISIDLFWQNGFSATSMQQLMDATGLKPGSLYLAFSNKEGLFREALEGYARKSIDRIRIVLESAPSIGKGVCSHLEAVIEQSTRADYCSCFLVKTRLELAARMEEQELYRLASSKLDEIEVLFRYYLAREYDESVSEQRATSIMLHIFGIRVYGYQRGAAQRMRQGVQAGLPWLPWK